MQILVLLGAPGSGKGTAAARLVENLGARHVSSGDVLRAAARSGTPAGLEAEERMQRGELVPDELVGRLIAQRLAACAREQPDGLLLLDGYPRVVAQAEMLARELAGVGGCVRKAVLLEVDEETVVARLSGRRVCPSCGASYHVRTLPPKVADVCDVCHAALLQRSDDNPETIRRRMGVFRERTQALIDWYDARQMLTKINGVGSPEVVAARIAEAVER